MDQLKISLALLWLVNCLAKVNGVALLGTWGGSGGFPLLLAVTWSDGQM